MPRERPAPKRKRIRVKVLDSYWSPPRSVWCEPIDALFALMPHGQGFDLVHRPSGLRTQDPRGHARADLLALAQAARKRFGRILQQRTPEVRDRLLAADSSAWAKSWWKDRQSQKVGR